MRFDNDCYSHDRICLVRQRGDTLNQATEKLHNTVSICGTESGRERIALLYLD
jgi:hypothetical protein